MVFGWFNAHRNYALEPNWRHFSHEDGAVGPEDHAGALSRYSPREKGLESSLEHARMRGVIYQQRSLLLCRSNPLTLVTSLPTAVGKRETLFTELSSNSNRYAEQGRRFQVSR